MIPDCDMEHRTWPEGPGALTKCSHILGWKERRYYSVQRSAGVPNGTDKQRGEWGAVAAPRIDQVRVRTEKESQNAVTSLVGRNAGTIPRSGVPVFPTGQTSKHKSQEARGLGPSSQGKKMELGGGWCGPSLVAQNKEQSNRRGKWEGTRSQGREAPGPRVIPDCDMEHRTWPERPGAVV